MKYIFTSFLILCTLATFSQNKKDSEVTNVKMSSATENAQAMQIFLKAEKSFVKGAYKKAASLYKEAYSIDSNFVDAIDNLALSYRRQYEMDSALHYYNISISKIPNNKGALNNVGLVYIYLEKYDNAIETFNKLLSFYPDHSESIYSISLAYLLAKDYNKAIEFATKAFEASKKSDKSLAADAVYIACKSYLSLEKKDEAKLFYKKAKSQGIKSQEAADELGI